MHRLSTVYKHKKSKTVLNKYVGWFWYERTGDGLFHWRVRYYGLWTIILSKIGLKLRRWICFLQTCSFSLPKILMDGVESCRLLVDYCDIFISCLNILTAPIHCRCDEETSSSTSWMAWEWVYCKQIFGWIIPLCTKKTETEIKINKSCIKKE